MLKLVNASPPFNYQSLNKMLLDLVRGVATYDQVEKAISGIGFEVQRNSYRRALAPAWKYIQSLRHNYALEIEARSYAISRNMRVPCVPPMVCGTQHGQVVPWLMLWKKNVLRDEQMALFVSLVSEVMAQDGELDSAELVVVDTSDGSLDKDGAPALIRYSDIEPIPQDQLGRMLETFVLGFKQAEEELKSKSSPRTRSVQPDAEDDDQFSLDI